jgi:predicted nucleic acid-binding protein
MVAYVDSSVLLRFVLQQPDAALELTAFQQRVTSLLAEVECMCAVDAAHSRGELDKRQWAERRDAAHRQLRRMRRLMPSRSIIRRAGEPLPVPLRSLDAIHLATALAWRERREPDLVFATHDRQQARAARALGFEVLGVEE